MLFLFIALQLLDAATTIFFLQHGVSEGNPLVKALFGVFTGPAAGLAMAKLAGVALAVCAWRTGRQRLLARVNVVFAACVLWNLAATALARA
jgi:sulfur relay (sulfurtransferase) complex TusBCD TusD component (DsrE family)